MQPRKQGQPHKGWKAAAQAAREVRPEMSPTESLTPDRACPLCGEEWWACGETMCPQPREPNRKGANIKSESNK